MPSQLTPLGVVVLALLREGDMHPYEMIRLLRIRREDRLVALTNGTFYHTVGRLERAGLLAEVGTDREGNRPERTTYTLTESGTSAVDEWVRLELPRIDRPAQFRVALAESHNLEAADAVALLRRRSELLAEAAAEHTERLEAARAKGVPGQVLVEVAREARMLAADLEWTRSLVTDIEDGVLPWGIAALTSPGDGYDLQREAARQ